MSLSRIIHHSHSLTRLEIYDHIYFINPFVVLSFLCLKIYGWGFPLNTACSTVHISQKLSKCWLIILVGAVSDGEFNSLRTQGSTRPLHKWQIIHDAKESVSRQSEQTLISMLKKTGGN